MRIGEQRLSKVANAIAESVLDLHGRVDAMHDVMFADIERAEGRIGCSGNGRPWGEELFTALRMAHLAALRLCNGAALGEAEEEADANHP